MIALWPGTLPGGVTLSGTPERSAKGALSHISTPLPEIFAPARPSGAAAVIAAGGGCKRIQMASEAYPAARCLTDRGIIAFVLSYRLPREVWLAGALAPLHSKE
jgi:acetyl esterase/lipase